MPVNWCRIQGVLPPDANCVPKFPRVWLLDVRCRREYLASNGPAQGWRVPERRVVTAPAVVSPRGSFYLHGVEFPMVAGSLPFQAILNTAKGSHHEFCQVAKCGD